MRATGLALLLTVGAGCTSKAGGHQAGNALAPSASVSSAPTSLPLASHVSKQDPAAAFRDANRANDWRAAAAHFEKLSREQKAAPELRYARAYGAQRLGDPTRVLTLTEDLSEALPLLGSEIQRMRAEAHLATRNYRPAAEYFSKRSAPEDLLKAARALARLDELTDARRHVDRALAAASKQKHSTELLAEIRAERVEIASRSKQTALAALDLRWLSVSAPTTAAAAHADLKLEQIKGQFLSKQERYQRALEFADAGRIQDVEAELAALKQAPGPPVAQAELLHVQAWAHYKKRDYDRAATLFDSAIGQGTRHRLKDTFYAARALSRADKDALAIERYGQFINSYPSSGLAEDARYLIARLHYVLGNWEQAALAYNKYLGKFSQRGRFHKTVRYELAVTRLAQGDFQNALKGLKPLVKDETSQRLKARYQLLLGIALAGANEKDHAKTVFRELIEELPLSFAALAARQRLTELGETPPPHLPPPSDEQALPLIVELPQKTALLHGMGLDEPAEAELENHEASLRAKYRPREYESLCQAYAQLSAAARQYRVGQQAANWRLLTKTPNPRTRWLWDCIYPRPYPSAVRDAETEFQLPGHLIYAVMRQESNFRPRVVSPANAIGLMQMIEPTAERVMAALGQNYDASLLEVPSYNIRFGAYYLRRLLDSFGQNIALSLAAYNAGPKAASRWLESGEKLPLDLFVARIPYSETRGYVERVIENLARYAYLTGGNEAVPELPLTIEQGMRAPPDAY